MPISIKCASCDTPLKVKDESAGKKVRCPSCGSLTAVPTAAMTDQDNVLAVVAKQEPQKASPVKRCPECRRVVGQSHVLCINCGLDLRTGRKHKSTLRTPRRIDDEGPKEKNRGKAVQVIVLVTGLVLLIAGAAWLARNNPFAPDPNEILNRVAREGTRKVNRTGPWKAKFSLCGEGGDLYFSDLSAKDLHKDGIILNVGCRPEDFPLWKAVPKGAEVEFSGKVDSDTVLVKDGRPEGRLVFVFDVRLLDPEVAGEISADLKRDVELLIAVASAADADPGPTLPSVPILHSILDPKGHKPPAGMPVFDTHELQLGALRLLARHGAAAEPTMDTVIAMLQSSAEFASGSPKPRAIIRACEDVIAVVPSSQEKCFLHILKVMNEPESNQKPGQYSETLRRLSEVKPEIALKALSGEIPCTNSTRRELKMAASRLGPKAAPLIPAFLRDFQDGEDMDRILAITALKKIGAGGDQIIPVMLEYLNTFAGPLDARLAEGDNVREERSRLLSVVELLGDFPDQAETTSPILVEISKRALLPHWPDNPFLHVRMRTGLSDELTKYFVELKRSADKALETLGEAARHDLPLSKEILEARHRNEIAPFTKDTSFHSRDLTGLAFSPDGSHIASASSDATLKLWDAKTGMVLRTFRSTEGHSMGVLGVSFSPDGKRIASASADRTAKVWDIETGLDTLAITGHKGYVSGVAFSQDGAHLATASNDGKVRVWNSKSGEETANITGVRLDTNDGNRDRVPLAFSPVGPLVAASGRYQVIIWDVKAEKKRHVLEFLPSLNVAVVTFSPDGTRIAAGGGTVGRVWDVETGKLLLSLRGTDYLLGLAFSPDGTRVAAGGGNVVQVWDVSKVDLNPLKSLEPTVLVSKAAKVTCIAFSPDGKRIAYGDASTLKFCDSDQKKK